MNIFLKVGIVTTLVFISGVIFGLVIGDEKVNNLESTISRLDENIQNANLQFLFFDTMNKNVSCTYLSKEAERLGEQADKLGRDVSMYENSKKISEKSFYDLKLRYTSILIKDWLMIEKIKRTCGENYTTVLYFYSNTNCDKCQEQGVVLSYLKEKLDGEILIFSIDGDLNSQIVGTLKDAYSINTYPSLVVNGNVTKGFVDLDSLESKVCDYNSNLSIC